ncbi:hypothetical protein MNBD_GAMMA23-254 [hydrothermal vent metagenome]|uniref:Uncharacterized protein n=1 Tax=hydrothermal vent metagenome TaxID=652676 RepID=A0A3B0ZFP6_9ZZZZ
MPYFLYKMLPSVSNLVKNIEQVGEYKIYKEAKQKAKELRTTTEADPDITYRIIFADNVIEAEERLHEKRPETVVKEWEK